MNLFKIDFFSYLEGSKAITQFDADTPALSRTYHHKMPLHFRQWYKKARTGLLEEEKNLWTTQKSIQIVRDFMKGKFSKREDLAIEKLIYEVPTPLSLSIIRPSQTYIIAKLQAFY